MKKYNHIPRLDKSVSFQPFYVKEKLDGMQLRFVLKDGKVQFGSKNVFPIDYNAVGGLNFVRIKPLLKQIESKIPKINMDNYIFYGELMVEHSIKYNCKHVFYGFDVYDIKQQKFVKNYSDLFNLINLPSVSQLLVKNKTIQEYIDSCKNTSSEIDATQTKEGYVFVDTSYQRRIKYHLPSFVNKIATSQMSLKEKIFHKYIDENKILELIEYMKTSGKYNKKNPEQSIITYVINDIYEELSDKETHKLIHQSLSPVVRKYITEKENIYKLLKQ